MITLKQGPTKMKILKINTPIQDCNTVNPEHPQYSFNTKADGTKWHSWSWPNWCVRTEMFPHRLGGLEEFIRRKEEFCQQKGLEGIYLLEVKARLQSGPNKNEKELIYYIRYDYIKPKQ